MKRSSITLAILALITAMLNVNPTRGGDEKSKDKEWPPVDEAKTRRVAKHSRRPDKTRF